MLKKNLKNDFSSIELENLSNNIRLKAIKLGISLPKLAELMQVDYSTLMRIVSMKKDYTPTFKILSMISSFFEVGISDLLKNSKLPQKIPILSMKLVHKYMNGLFTPSENDKMFISNEWIHEKSCAIEIDIIYCGIPTLCTFILKPYTSVKMNKYFLIESKDKPYLIKITKTEDQNIYGTNLLDNSLILIDSPVIIAIASQIILHKNLI